MNNKVTYFFILISSFFFTYIFSVKETYTFFYMLIILPLIDYIVFKIACKNVDVSVTLFRSVVDKNTKVLCRVAMKNNSLVPVPFISLELEISKLLDSENLYITTSLSKKEKIIREIEVIPKHIGIGEINIKYFQLSSLFGLFKKKIDLGLDDNKVMILPQILESKGILNLVEETINSSEDNEEDYRNIKGEVGYDYKEYVAGEPLNRVNWKLSSKRNQLVIRKDSMVSKSKKVIVLDSYLLDTSEYYNISDLLIEGALALANSIYIENYDVSIMYRLKGKWIIENINSFIDIEELQKKLAIYKFTEEENRFSNISIQHEVNYIIVTNNKDFYIKNLFNILQEHNNSVSIVSNSKNRIFEKEFYIRENCSVERI